MSSKADDYSITSAPRVIKGRVITGTSGSEFGVRGDGRPGFRPPAWGSGGDYGQKLISARTYSWRALLLFCG
jgi:hypothetical protein